MALLALVARRKTAGLGDALPDDAAPALAGAAGIYSRCGQPDRDSISPDDADFPSAVGESLYRLTSCASGWFIRWPVANPQNFRRLRFAAQQRWQLHVFQRVQRRHQHKRLKHKADAFSTQRCPLFLIHLM